MKKSLLSLALTAASLSAFATDYTGSLTATLGTNSIDANDVTVSIEQTGTSYSVTIKEFTADVAGMDVNVGPVAYTDVTKSGNTYTGSLSDAKIAQVPRFGAITLTQVDLNVTEKNGGLTLTSEGTANLFGATGSQVSISFVAPETGTGSDSELGEGVYFFEDFEWMAPWTEVGNGKPCGTTVESDDPNANAPQLATPKVDGVRLYDALVEKGYTFLATHAASKEERQPEKQIYPQTNYLKFGLTGYSSGIVIPVSTEIAADKATTFMFDWCSMRQGSGTWDPTELVIIVNYNGSETTYPLDAWNYENGATYAWEKASLNLPAGSIGKGATISVRNCDNQWPGGAKNTFRWFIDNIKLCDTSLAAIGDINVDEAINENAPVEYFNLQGVRVNGENLPAGLYIRRQGSKATKILVR